MFSHKLGEIDFLVSIRTRHTPITTIKPISADHRRYRPNAANIITLSAIKPEMSERWPEPGVVTVRRWDGIEAAHGRHRDRWHRYDGR